MATYFRARDRRECPATEALDARGVLKSGYGRRVPAQMQDGASRFDWGAQGAPPMVTDARRLGGTEGSKPGFRVSDRSLGRAEREAAYREHETFLRDAWRTPPPRDAGFGSLDKKLKKYNARGQEEGYLEETEEGDAASVGDAKKKEDPPVTGRSRCPECDGRGVVHGKTCQGCGGDGWVDDEDDEGDEEDDGNGDSDSQGERVRPVTADRRTVDQIAHDHIAAMERIYAARNREISDAWREGKATNG